jgi:hypothetical protein
MQMSLFDILTLLHGHEQDKDYARNDSLQNKRLIFNFMQ